VSRREPALRVPRLGVDPDVFKRQSHAPCGTYGGAQHHKKAGEPLCAECAAANADYAAWRRFKTGHIRKPRACPLCGSVFTQHQCGAPLEGAT
jgi:hypothetical protein